MPQCATARTVQTKVLAWLNDGTGHYVALRSKDFSEEDADSLGRGVPRLESESGSSRWSSSGERGVAFERRGRDAGSQDRDARLAVGWGADRVFLK